tara:strand:- start:310 stop:972 length:663 start_codon:yes stop_codon:yes gene_type:complete
MAIAWSYSSLKTFQQCPRKYYHTKVAKDVKDSDTTATLYGKSVHTAAEEYIRDGVALPPQFGYLEPMLEQLKEIPGEKHCELRLGLTEDLEPCDFFADNVWWRGIADLVIVDKEKKLAYSVDYKTSKNARYADIKQLELVATALFKHFPEVERIKSALMFVVSNEFVRAVHKPENIELYLEKPKQDLNRLTAAFNNDVWNAVSGPLCRFCPVRQCEHNKS